MRSASRQPIDHWLEYLTLARCCFLMKLVIVLLPLPLSFSLILSLLLKGSTDSELMLLQSLADEQYLGFSYSISPALSEMNENFMCYFC